MGAITIPRYPSREITPNEVFDLVDRLVLEIVFFEPDEKQIRNKQKRRGKTPDDVYKILWEVSKALDRVIGIRGLRPTDVYSLSQQVVEISRFLRLTQNLSPKIKRPTRTKGKHPNHALAVTIDLTQKIARAEKNLWMKPIAVPHIPQRTVAPEEVYDALLLVIAELRRIQYRLGVERSFALTPIKGNKSPDDVIYNISVAIALLPDFAKRVPLVLGDQAALEKSPNDVYLVTEHILNELMKYRQYRGIRTVPRQVPPQVNLKPRHVYTKTLECLEKVERLRKQMGLGGIALPGHPLRSIAPSEVYQQAVRLDEELGVIYQSSGMEAHSVQLVAPTAIYRYKTPSDVFAKMWEISYLLDTIIGREGYKPTDVYLQAKRIVKTIIALRRHLAETGKVSLPPMREAIIPADVLQEADETTSLLTKIKRRAGILETAVPLSSPEGDVTPDDSFNKMGLILSDLITLQVHFGMARDVLPLHPEEVTQTPSHVYQQIEYANMLLREMLVE